MLPVSGFQSATVDLSLVVLSPEYQSRQNLEHITTEIEGVTVDAQIDIRLLSALFSGVRPPKPSDVSRIKDLGYQIFKHEKSFQRLLSQIKGHEDWSNLSIKDSVMFSKGGLSPGGKKNVSFGSSTSSVRDAPPSPYQATVEDDPDGSDSDGADHFQTNPSLYSPIKIPEVQQDTSPPRVIIRSPTDPNTLESGMKELNFDSPMDDQFHNAGALPRSGSEDTPTITKRGRKSPPVQGDHEMSASAQSLSNTSQRPRSRSQIEAELKRLTAEIAQIRDLGESGSSSRSRHSPSQSVDSTSKPSDTFMRPPQQGRARANTASSADSRPTMSMGDQGSSALPRFARPPHVSPRYSPLTPTSPMSPVESSRDAERRGKRTRDSLYGADPHVSLPTVLETGLKTESRPSAGRNKRASWAAEDFGQFFNQSYTNPDPPLFPSSSKPTPADRPPAPQRTPTSSKDDLPPGVTQKRLPVSLEDICLGASKKVRFKRRVPDAMGVKLVEDTKILTVRVYPGLKPGSRIKHPDEGDYNPETGRLGEVWFLLVEQDHERFERRDRDLHAIVEIPLVDALCGWTRTIRSICGKDVKVKQSGVTNHGWREYFAGLGMPKYDRENREQGGLRGDMVVEVRIVMPPRLEDWQREMIRRALPSLGSSR